jgi:hypothetical protein
MAGIRSLVTIEHVAAAGVSRADIDAESMMELGEEQTSSAELHCGSALVHRVYKSEQVLKRRHASGLVHFGRLDAVTQQLVRITRRSIVKNNVEK